MGGALVRMKEGKKRCNKVAPTSLDLDLQSINSPILNSSMNQSLIRNRLWEENDETSLSNVADASGNTIHYSSLGRQYATLENSIEL
jgi:hypothetical protein